METSSDNVNNILENFNSFIQKPVKYLTVQSDVKEDIKGLVKSLYDYTKAKENALGKGDTSVLPKLIIKDFDEEQIWQEIELQNSACWDRLISDVSSCMAVKDSLKFPLEEPEETLEEDNAAIDSDVNEEMGSIENEEESGNELDESNYEQKPGNIKKKKGKSSIVDDNFFKLSEMEEFLLKEERNDGNSKKKSSDSDEESIDMFEEEDDDDEEEEEGNNVMYSDFFDGNEEVELISKEHKSNKNGIKSMEIDDNESGSEDENMQEEEEIMDNEPQKKKKRVRFSNVASSSSDDESDPEQDILKPTGQTSSDKQSEFEQRQIRLKKQIAHLENRSLTEAPWQLKGEVKASIRPQNSLLEEVVDFDLTSRPAPIITEKTTVTLEEIIMQRIKDKLWDDVVRKEKPVDDALVFRKPVILNQAKSEMSLAQVYEAEYLKQKHSKESDADPKEPEAHVQIRDDMKKLFSKLDALCHYHYTPKAAQAEVKIVSNTPAINMEEVAPIATSNAALLAPEEVKNKQKGELLGKEERTDTDKKRERRKKKKLQKEKGQLVKDSGKVKKPTAVKEGKSVKTSKVFFEQLNDNVASVIKPKKKRNVTN